MIEENHKSKENNHSDDELVARLQAVLADQKSLPAETAAKGFKLFSKDVMILAALVILVAISGVQTFKLSSLQAAGGSATSPAPAVSGSGSSSGGPTLPASLDNLPSQVGGC